MPPAPPRPLHPDAARRALAVRDLTDPAAGPHALQRLAAEIEDALTATGDVRLERHRANPVVPVADNYDRLRYPPGAAARDSRYTRYLSPDLMLRAHTTAMIPPLLEALAAAAPSDDDRDVLLSCPGITYRRDVIDRHHVGEPHQIDLWRVRACGPPLAGSDLDTLVATVVAAALPGLDRRAVPASHPYTRHGRQIDVRDPRTGDWVEVGECGLAHPEVLAAAGLPPATTGLAMGLGLDRLLMLRKGVDDIRLLRSTDPRIAGQMQDLDPYVPVSSMPPARRDLSLALDADVDAELLGDRVRDTLGSDARVVERVEILGVTPGDALPSAAWGRLGLRPGQSNVVLRLVLRDLERTLTAQDANAVRDRVYAGLHQGTVYQWAVTGPD